MMVGFIDMVDEIEISFPNSEGSSTDIIRVSSLDIINVWHTNIPLTEDSFADEEAKSIFVSAFQDYVGESREDSQLALEPGGWTIEVSQNLLSTSLAAALLTGILHLLDFDSLPGYVIPAVLPSLIDIKKVKLKKCEEYILAELRLNPKIRSKHLTAKEIFEELDDYIKDQISFPDFIDFLDKLHISGDAVVSKGGEYKINRRTVFKITFL